MRRTISIGPAATLEICGVTVQSDHRRPINPTPFVGEGRVAKTSECCPLVEPTHLVGVERSETEMLGKLLR